MEPLASRPATCPACGETIELLIDCSAGDQEYVEDCAVCCRPMLVTVTGAGTGALTVATRAENG